MNVSRDGIEGPNLITTIMKRIVRMTVMMLVAIVKFIPFLP